MPTKKVLLVLALMWAAWHKKPEPTNSNLTSFRSDFKQFYRMKKIFLFLSYKKKLQGGTFTISNLGMFGVKNFSAVINPPQVKKCVFFYFICFFFFTVTYYLRTTQVMHFGRGWLWAKSCARWQRRVSSFLEKKILCIKLL